MAGTVSPEIIETKILSIRGHKVMLDRDLAALYGVETEQLTRQVRRNIERFPPTFLLHLTYQELTNLKRQFGGSSWGSIKE
ncbi:MAG: ORF6N domain-containing protein [Candidatus Omnitrophica bacterium]|nr:ORF6N domain-containing protein [Candidatus Omnitrophota bacterium]